MMEFLDWRSVEVEEDKEEKRVLAAVRIKRASGVLATSQWTVLFSGGVKGVGFLLQEA